MVGLLLRPPPKVALVYLVGLVLAFDMSLGLSGHTYRFLYEHVPLYQGLRALARLGIFVVFFLAALARIRLRRAGGRSAGAGRGAALAVVLCAVLLARVSRASARARAVSQHRPAALCLARQRSRAASSRSCRCGARACRAPIPAYSYLSTFHWQPIVNGYSGFYPGVVPGAARRRWQGFPTRRSIRRLREDGVRYVVVHLAEFDRAPRRSSCRTLRSEFGLAELTRQSDGEGEPSCSR